MILKHLLTIFGICMFTRSNQEPVMTTSQKIPPAPTWDLESLFPGGSKSKQFQAHSEKVRKSIEKAKENLGALPKTLDDSAIPVWASFIMEFQDLIENIELSLAYPHCLVSQDVSDSDAHSAEAEGHQFLSEWEKLRTELDSLALKQSDEAWQKLLATDEISKISYFLNESRELAKKKMTVELESLALELSVDGLHAWNRLYDKMAGDLRADFEEGGEKKSLSLGQLATKISAPERSVRAQAFKKMTEAWESRADHAAMILNSLAGFRLALNGRRGWESALFEPLKQSRLSLESLEAMWSVIERETQKLAPYIEAKKKLLGIDKFRWYDEFAPCGKTDKLYAYDDAADFIVKNVGEFSSDMAGFCRKAVDKRWIEAEDRSGKAGGGYCTGTGPLRESRIFMTYAGSYENLLTLAHELGHAYHGHVLKDAPFLAADYPMTLAETASIFSELLVTDAALADCSDPKEKLMLLEQKLQQPFVFFTDIHCRFLFERAFYDERKKGVISKDKLSELMVAAQKKAFGPLLDESGYHPLFWASKLHFFISGVSFYNYPY
ncbi:MAG: oligoendopeptidase, partial [Candidatus Zixiibacteriota bacterium]